MSGFVPSLKKIKPSPPTLCVIVEDHNHVLEHIHSAIRSKSLPFSALRMLHFDSHPDLACSPSIDPDLIFNPRELYEALDTSPGGIAEWILPLVYGKHLSHVYWVKNIWSHQIESGDYDLFVVKQQHNALMKVGNRTNAELPYYVDDSSFVKLLTNPPSSKYSNKVEFNLRVGTTTHGIMPENLFTTPWILDICLDYFAVLNPFLSDFPPKLAKSILGVSTQVIFRARPETLYSSDKQSDPILTARIKWEVLLAAFLTIEVADGEWWWATDSASCLPDMYETRRKGSKLLETLREEIVAATNHNEVGSPDAAGMQKITKMCIDVIPVSMLPHCDTADDTFTTSFIKEDVEKVSSFLYSLDQELEGGTGSMVPPGLITIARSVDDGFTPRHVVEELQAAVLKMVHAFMCCRFNIDIQVKRDYGEHDNHDDDEGGKRGGKKEEAEEEPFPVKEEDGLSSEE